MGSDASSAWELSLRWEERLEGVGGTWWESQAACRKTFAIRFAPTLQERSTISFVLGGNVILRKSMWLTGESPK